MELSSLRSGENAIAIHVASPIILTDERNTISSSNTILSPSSSTPHYSYTNILGAWCHTKLCSSDRVERHFACLLVFIIGSSILFTCLKTTGPVYTWGSLLCNIWALLLFVVTMLNFQYERDHKLGFEITRFLQFLLCMLSVLIYYDGSNVINRYRYMLHGDSLLWDAHLLRMDELLLGWLYPKGQLALYLDTQHTFGATSQLGHCYQEVFQILYISYYVWGNAIGVLLAWSYFYHTVYKSTKGTKKRLQWRRIQMFACAWVGGFVMNHLVNLCFPAVSPRIYICDQYQNEIEGLWILPGLRSAVTNAAANTFSAFPSGHCGLSILAFILARKIDWHRHYTYVVGVTSVLIILATQVLRYHYFVDFLFSLPIVYLACWFGGFHNTKVYEHNLVCQGLEEYDDDGKPTLTSPRNRANSELADDEPLLKTNVAINIAPILESNTNKLSATTTLVRSSSLGKLQSIDTDINNSLYKA